MLRSIALISVLLLTPTAAHAQRSVAQAATLGDLSRSLQDLSQKVSTSVVQIFVTGFAPPDEDDPHASAQPVFERSSGSGVVVDADGYIVTNAHVVENADEVTVKTTDRREYTAKVVGSDPSTDVAVRQAAGELAHHLA